MLLTDHIACIIVSLILRCTVPAFFKQQNMASNSKLVKFSKDYIQISDIEMIAGATRKKWDLCLRLFKVIKVKSNQNKISNEWKNVDKKRETPGSYDEI